LTKGIQIVVVGPAVISGVRPEANMADLPARLPSTAAIAVAATFASLDHMPVAAVAAMLLVYELAPAAGKPRWVRWVLTLALVLLHAARPSPWSQPIALAAVHLDACRT
jgi:hypothetical protein